MPFVRNIHTIDLVVNDKAVSFAVKTMHEIESVKTPKTEEPHRHNFYTIIWAIDAKGEHRIDLNTFPVEKNTLFFIHPEQVHQFNSESNSEGIVILFTQEFLIKNGLHEKFINGLNLFNENSGANFLKLSENDQELNELAVKMKTVFLSSDAYREAKFSAYLQLFLIHCFELTSQQIHVPESFETLPEIVLKFRKMVETNYLEWHKVSDYAEKLMISPNYLNEVIKKNTGRTAKEHIRNRLVAEAKRLSHFTHLSAKEIGFQLGFNDPSHFAKFAKKYVSKNSI